MTSATDILHTQIYPRLTHDAIFGDLSGFRRLDNKIYSDCPACGRKGHFYAYDGGHYGMCNARISCGAKIGWWDHVQKSFGLSTKRDVLRKLAELASVSLVPKSNLADKAANPGGVRELFIRYGQQALFSKAGEGTRNYLLTRGFTPDEMKTAGFMHVDRRQAVGYLYRHASETAIKESCVLTKGFGDEYKLLMPYYDEEGGCIGFTGRLVELPATETRSKYKFSYGLKKESFFNMHKAVRCSPPSLILVEGPIDCLLLDAKGVRGCVALCGNTIGAVARTSTLKVNTGTIVFALSADAAGANGVKSILRNLHMEGKENLFVVPHYYGKKDVGELVADGGIDAFNRCLEETAVSVPKWLFSDILPKIRRAGDYGREKAVKALTPLYANLPEESKKVFLEEAQKATFLHPREIRQAVSWTR